MRCCLRLANIFFSQKIIMKIIIVSIDALRADSLSCYGYERKTSPNIDAIAAEGVLFRHAYTPANWTNPSYFSLITALYPSVHGVTRHHHAISGQVNTLPESLARKGYRTLLYSNYYTLLDAKRFGRHFQEQVYFDMDQDGEKLNKRIIALREEDFFLLIHIGNYVHEPYCAPAQLVREFWPREFPRKTREIRHLTEEQALSDESMRDVLRRVNLRRTPLSRIEVAFLKACYDAGIKHVDRWIGEFFGFIKKIYGDEYIFIVTADHGQGFFEHGFFGHGLNLHQELVRIPLIFQGRGKADEEIESSVGLTDLFPTLMDIAGFEIPPGIDGVSVRPCLEGKQLKSRPIICEGFPFVACIRDRKKLIISFYRLMPWKETLKSIGRLIRSRNYRGLLLHIYSFFKTGFFDLQWDPGEEKNRSGGGRAELKKMKRYMKEWYRQCRTRALKVTEQEIEEERTIEQLKSLGYL